jgi:lipopolysaccharide export system protein LptA
MARSHRKNNLRFAGAAVALGLSGVALAASEPCTKPIVLEAKPVEVDYRNNNALLREVVITQCDTRIQAGEARATGGLNFENSRWTFSGDVRIDAEGGNLKSDKAIVSFRDNVISQASITGTPAQFEQKRDDGTMSRGHANTINYEISTGTVSFETDAWLAFGQNELSGQQLVYNIRTQSVQGQKAIPGNPDKSRIKFVIQPNKPPEKPAADPEKKP